jgi:TolB-like protein/class 3 adenylate cyclase
MSETRKIAAILAADVAGYSRLAGADEERTLARLRALRSDLIDPTIAVHHGRIVKRTGDGALVEFRSVVEAVRCAIEVQSSMVERNAGLPPDRRIDFRIGIHLGDIVEESDGDLMGDGVNIAARLEGIAKPGAICLSEDAYRQVKARFDLSVSDLGATMLKNIAEPIRVYSLEVGVPPVANPTLHRKAGVPDRAPETLEQPDRPSIAVLPFQNMSGDPEQEYFADGIVEDIITALSRFRSLFVIARNSSFTYRGRAVDIKQVGRELGVRYVLEGSVRKAGNKVRITGQLIDSDTGAHLWADRFDGSLEDVFELQDQVTTSVVAAIAPKITQAEIERARRKPAGSLDSYDLYLRALALSHQFTPESLGEAVALLHKATEIDPSYAPAAALSLFCFGWWHSEARGQRPQTDEAVRLARQMMANPTDDPDVLWMVGWCLAYLAGETVAGASLIERGLALNLNSAQAWLASAYVNCFACRNDAALKALERAMRLSPLDPLGHLVKFAFALAHLQSGRYEEAIEWADRALIQKPGFTNAMIVRTAACGHLNRREEAREWVRRIHEIAPQLTVSSIKQFLSEFFVPEALAYQVDGLAEAGLPQQ